MLKLLIKKMNAKDECKNNNKKTKINNKVNTNNHKEIKYTVFAFDGSKTILFTDPREPIDNNQSSSFISQEELQINYQQSFIYDVNHDAKGKSSG